MEKRYTKKQSPLRINSGTASLLLVFVILSLISFAALSIVSAQADKRLNDKLVNRTTEYYRACNEANEYLMKLDLSLRRAYENSENKEDYFAAVGESSEIILDMGEMQSLTVSVDINYPENTGDGFYTITAWRLDTIETIELDESLNLMQFN